MNTLPQIIYIVFIGLSLGISLVQHGKTSERKENFWSTLLASALMIGLLYWGGFFNPLFK
jgi:hypothetical protein